MKHQRKKIVMGLTFAFIVSLIGRNLLYGTGFRSVAFLGGVVLFISIFIMVLLISGGNLSPIAFKAGMEKIGLANRRGETPILLTVRDSPDSTNGFVLTILNRGISLEDFENARERIESKLDIIIDRIRYLDGSRRIIQIYAVPAYCDLPRYLQYSTGCCQSIPGRIVLGQGLTGTVSWDYTSQIHALIAGTTGSGKSALVRLILYQLISQLILSDKSQNSVYILDFKGVDFNHPFFRENSKLIFDETTFCEILRELVSEMQTRLAELRRSNKKNIDEYNEGIRSTWKHIFVVIDEASELFSRKDDPNSKTLIKEILGLLASICRLGRAAGIHVILATQRPSSDTVPGTLKACIDAKICGRVTSDTESIIVLDNADAVKRITEPIPGRFLFNDTLFQAFYFDDSIIDGGDIYG